MPSVSIVIDVSGEAAGVPGQARTFAYSKIASAAPTVTLSLSDTTGVTSYFWEIVDKPSTSSAVLSDPTAAAPTFSASVGAAGTYLIRCTINSGIINGTNAVAFTTQNSALRKLAAAETLEFDSLRGWTAAYNTLVDVVDSGGGGGGVTQLSDLSDVGVSTATAGNLLVADGGNWDSVAVSGAVTLDATGAVSFVSTAETVVQDADLLLIYDNSASDYRRMTRANFLSGFATSLDEAYDAGGAGAGRAITVDSGSVHLTASASAALEIDGDTGGAAKILLDDSAGTPAFAVRNDGGIYSSVAIAWTTSSINSMDYTVDGYARVLEISHGHEFVNYYDRYGVGGAMSSCNLYLNGFSAEIESSINAEDSLVIWTDTDDAAVLNPGIRIIHRNPTGLNIDADVRVQSNVAAGTTAGYTYLGSYSYGGNATVEIGAQSAGTVADTARIQIGSATTGTAVKEIAIGLSANSEQVKITSGDGNNPGTPDNGWVCYRSDLNFLCDQDINLTVTDDSGSGNNSVVVTASNTGTSTGDSTVHLVSTAVGGDGEIRFTDNGNSGSTWTQTYMLLSDGSSSTWDAFEAKYGEVSLMEALNSAGSGATTTVSSSTYTVLATDDTILVDYTTTGTCVITIPTAVIGTDGFKVTIKDSGGSASLRNITINTGGSETIDGYSNATINGDFDSLTLVSDGSNLFII